MTEQLILLGATLLAVSGLPGLVTGAWQHAPDCGPGLEANHGPGCGPLRGLGLGPWVAIMLSTAGALAGLAGSVMALAGRIPAELSWLPRLHPRYDSLIGVDALSSMFMAPVFLVTALGGIYGAAYWTPRDHPEDAARLRAFYGILGAAMAVLLCARDAVLFLSAWETMALCAFPLITSDDRNREVREAGWIYLVATHAGTLSLLVLCGWMGSHTGGFSLAAAAGPVTMTAPFILALLGFGLKAGIMPLHVWLPGAHANAPSHVSAIMSGVVIKMGIYGILRVTAGVAVPPAWWGWLVLTLGGISAVLGVAYAIGQHDLKRLLAYHSVENIGIITIGIGLALLGRSCGEPTWIVLGLGGALLHVWNHSLFKSLLFLSAGSVIHATGTRDIDALGGLAKRMPLTAAAFLTGAVAICGLPPLNGFVSELLIYLGLFRTAATGPAGAAALAAPALAMVGALAVACFVKAFGAVFLGAPRSTAATAVPGESPAAMIAPMAVLALGCAVIGLAPGIVAPALDRAIGAWCGGTLLPPAGSLVPFGAVSGLGVGLIFLTASGGILLRRRFAREPPRRALTWDCGYAAPTPRMQYTSSSFADSLVQWFAWALRPEIHPPRVEGFFPRPASFSSHVPDAVLHRLLLPAARTGSAIATRLRVLQQGRIQTYVTYILAAVITLLALGTAR